MYMKHWIRTALAGLVVGGLLASAAPGAMAQIRRRVIVIEPAPFWWGYPYPYSPYYYGPYPANYGEVKIDTHRKDLSVYVDGGYAAQTSKDKKFALKPGNHEIELRNGDGQTVLKEQVAVIVGKTTKLHVS